MSRLRILAFLLLVAVTVAPAADASREHLALRLRGEIERFVSERSEPDARVFVPPLDGLVPEPTPEDLVFELSTADSTRFEGMVPVTVVMRDAGLPFSRAVVTVRVEAFSQTVVAKRPLRTGEVIREADLVVEPRLRDRLPTNWTQDQGDVLGRRVSRPVRAGAPVQTSAVEEPPVVRRGQRVTVRLHSGSLRIDLVGRAREDGRPGDVIRVQNPSSRRDVLGRVDPGGVVLVQF